MRPASCRLGTPGLDLLWLHSSDDYLHHLCDFEQGNDWRRAPGEHCEVGEGYSLVANPFLPVHA